MIKLAVAGAAGKMGKAILGGAFKDKAFQVTGALEHASSPSLGKDLGEILGLGSRGVKISSDLSAVLKKSDVLIDFTHPTAIASNLDACVKTKTAYVLGTTGFDAKTKTLLQKASKTIAIVQSPNMSVGVNLLFKLAELTAEILDESYDIEISEAHHRMKKDSPSGTAVKLLELVAAVRKKDLKKDVVYGREGEIGVRPKGQIGVLALRGGDVIGDHTVFFFGDGERLELTHKASSRDAFALGALRAAKFVASHKSGLYNMQNVLGM